MLIKLNVSDVLGAPDPLVFLRDVAGLEAIPDPDTRRNLADALSWCLDRIPEALTPAKIRARIRVGDERTLLSTPGIHLLSGHIGKSQQFDWVTVVGAEDGVIPDFRAKTTTATLEEARILSVMISRARHGVVVTCSAGVPDASRQLRNRKPSPYFAPAPGCPVHRQ
jgi:DNA helicase-2/ATP-dependent DNA helicase PcrA